MEEVKPFVSVIIPVYKVEPYLRQCIDSVLAQTYRNLEIILVDDGSPDECPAICDEYAKNDARVRVIHKENGGLSDARNAGIRAATGEWICFVDSDDMVHPQMIELLMCLLVSDRTLKIASCGFERFCKNEIGPRHYTERNHSVLSLKDFMLKHCWTVAWGKIYHRTLFENIAYPVGRLHEDEFITYKLVYEAGKIALMDIPLYFYRQRKDSIMGQLSEKNILDVCDAFSERIIFFQDEPELYDIAVQHLLAFYINLSTKKYRTFVRGEIALRVRELLIKCDKRKLCLKTRLKRIVKLHFRFIYFLYAYMVSKQKFYRQ